MGNSLVEMLEDLEEEDLKKLPQWLAELWEAYRKRKIRSG